MAHPVAATARHSTVLVWFSAGPRRFHRGPVGQHNTELLTALGLSETEIRALEADAVIGGLPAVVWSSAKSPEPPGDRGPADVPAPGCRHRQAANQRDDRPAIELRCK
ncbi:hypothetical protein AB0346_15465 [Nocardia beijingensis]|uniref:hypothetical protein n=1 Tax=Nocardia beijingensis TaxID=95162 RepID=UPI00344DEEC9